VSPLARTEHALLPWTSFAIVPMFALANAGVRLTGDALTGAATSPVTLGIVLGLVVGKVIGISGASALAVVRGVATLPTGVRLPHVVGAGTVAGIGFTVSLFIAELAFDDPGLIAEAKVGILAASAIAGVAGWLALRAAPSAPTTADDDAV
jgi:NhaA family Na+:H+ antiporter